MGRTGGRAGGGTTTASLASGGGTHMITIGTVAIGESIESCMETEVYRRPRMTPAMQTSRRASWLRVMHHPLATSSRQSSITGSLRMVTTAQKVA